MPVHPVVKADAYGHGALHISRALVEAGADGLCVAAADEALALRAGAITAPIRVMYPVPIGVIDALSAAGVVIPAGDPAGLDRIIDERAQRASGAPARSVDLEIEVETGLGRGGFAPDRVVDAMRRIEEAPGVRLVGLWTHLQATEDLGRTAAQLALFDGVARAIVDAGLRVPPRHVAASGGVLTGVAAYDGIRPGLSIYGIVPDELEGSGLSNDTLERIRPVMSLHAQPVRVADLPPDHGISYGPTFTTARPTRIATLPLGYGDGMGRALSNRAEALVRGRRVPFVGNVAMDAIMVDVTDVPGPPVTTDDEFVLLGSQGGAEIPVEELARLSTTNTWEVLTSMAGRMPRVYHAASGPTALRTLTSLGG